MRNDDWLTTIRAALACGDTVNALRFAVKYKSRGEQAETIRRAWAAHQNPDFYRQIGEDPEALIAAGVQAMREKYSL